MVRSSDVLSHIRPLDIIFFRGTDLLSHTIRECERHHANIHSYDCSLVPSHIGIVVSRELIPHVACMEPSKLYLLESTITYGYVTSTSPIIDGVKNGVQLRELKRALDVYCNPPLTQYDKFCATVRACPPSAYWGRLRHNPYKTQHARRVMTRIYDLLMSQPYDLTFVQQFGSTFRCMRGISRSLVSKSRYIFCSQLVAIIIDQLGICGIPDCSCVCPLDFIHMHCKGKRIIDAIMRIPTDTFIECS